MSQPQTQTRPSRSLAGKVAIVTGAGTAGEGIGNGRAIAILLAEDGASVVCVDRDAALAARTAEMIGDEGRGRALAVAGDVTREADCAAAVEAAVRAYGRVDILVNNVGVLGPRGTATETDPAAWARGLEVNVTSMALMAKHAIPAMLRNGGGEDGDDADDEGRGQGEGQGHAQRRPPPPPSEPRGSIVNVGSVAGLRGGTPSLLYPTSKGAVVNMTRAMAAHHGPQGVRVNCVCPGMLYTPMMHSPDAGAGPSMSEATREARRHRSLLGTEGNAWDAAAAVRFLAGGEARWITGTVLTVDAGATCSTAITME
ncbi:tropinone reductase [Purpureocillium lavendulum]|uniref:Tropinone reductase n=1 Tax=Purpureocillium lavendulum TaxID=1247861 RepID=A0AB34FU51_9HYPO|nr:tropinone reductase [Purpureocillium lavendulum]